VNKTTGVKVATTTTPRGDCLSVFKENQLALMQTGGH
jgi:hypothetical protein